VILQKYVPSKASSLNSVSEKLSPAQVDNQFGQLCVSKQLLLKVFLFNMNQQKTLYLLIYALCSR